MSAMDTAPAAECRGLGGLFSVPTTTDATVVESDRTAPGAVQRLEMAYQPRYQRFVVKDKNFTQQFSHIYNRRLAQLTPEVRAEAERLWGGGSGQGQGQELEFVDRLVNIQDGDSCVAIGTTYKLMKLRPNILVEFREERGLSSATVVPADRRYMSDDDSLVLEDESGRLSLEGPGIKAASLCTGLVIAVKGVVKGTGVMCVEEWCSAGLPPMASSSLPQQLSPPKSEGYVLLVSGLQSGGIQDPLLTSLLVDMVAGYLGDESDQKHTSARISRVIVCGDSLAAPSANLLNGGGLSKRLTKEQQRLVASPLKELDRTMALLAAAVPVDLMPGEMDPANYTLPQQPLHPCLLTHASAKSSLQLVTNPYEASIGGRVFLGTSGQPLKDMDRYSKVEAEEEDQMADGQVSKKPPCLVRLESMLRWRHLAPTAPETLGCYPFISEDPFVIEECPDVLFAGNQPCFATSLLRGKQGQEARIVCVPQFAKSGEAVLVDVVTLACTTLRFGAGGVGQEQSWG